MPIIEGIGDEVIYAFVVLTISAIIFLYTSLSHRSPSDVETVTPTTTTTTIPEVAGNEQPEPTPASSSASLSSTASTSTTNQNLGTTTSESWSDLQPDRVGSGILVDSSCESSDVETSNASQKVDREVVEEDDDDLPQDSAGLRKRRLNFFEKGPDENSSPSRPTTSDGQATSNRENEKPPSEPREESDKVISLRLKYLNDTERHITTVLDEKVGEFKSKHFAEDLAARKIIRLIFNGQLLQNPESTLQSFGISNNCVVHVQISQPIPQPEQPTQSDNVSELDLSHMMWPLFAVLIAFMWILNFQYKEYFSGIATVALAGITILFVTVMWGQHRPVIN